MRPTCHILVYAVLGVGAMTPAGAVGEATASDDAHREESGDGPVPRFMSIEELTADVGFESELQSRTVRTDSLGWGRPRFAQRNKQYRFQETLGLTGRGSLIDERVLLYDAMIRGGLSQERFTEDSSSLFFDKGSSPNGTIFEYDLRLQAFPVGKVSGSGYASKLDDRIPRPFLPSLDRTREKYGAGLFYNDPKLPMRLTFDHLFDDITSRSNYLQDDQEQGEDSLRYETTWQPTENHALSLEFEHERRSDKYSGTNTRFDTTRNYFSLNDAIQFGLDNRSRLDTLLRVEEERGDLPRDVFEFAPQLRLQHTDSLFTNYKAQYLKEKYFDLETDTWRGDWGITHQFKDILTSSLGFYGLQQSAVENADLSELGALANFAYSKKNDSGIFSSNLSYLHSHTSTDDGRQSGVVIDESVTFRDPLSSYLAHPNVDVGSIHVRDANGLRAYRRGIDYRVLRIKNNIALQRIPTGLILDRQTVLVSYRYRVFDDFKVDRDRIDLRVQQDFEMGLTPYYALSWQDEKVDPQDFLLYRDRNINRHRIGFTYRTDKWSAGPEYEFNDDSIDPYHALHANADAILFQNDRQQLNIRGAASHFRFEGQRFLEQRYTTLVDLGLTHRYALGPRLEANSAALYRFQTDSLFGETNGVDLTASISYKIGYFTIFVEAEYDMLELPYSSDDSLGIWLKVRREIPIIGRPRG